MRKGCGEKKVHKKSWMDGWMDGRMDGIHEITTSYTNDGRWHYLSHRKVSVVRAKRGAVRDEKRSLWSTMPKSSYENQ